MTIARGHQRYPVHPALRGRNPVSQVLRRESPAQATPLTGVLRRAFGLVALACAACGAPGGDGAERCVTGTSQDGIVGGTQSSALVELGGGRRRALVLVVLPAAPGGDPPTCTAVVVSPGVALTARHCLDHDGNGSWDGAALDATVVGESGALLGAVDDVALHAELDVAVLHAGSLATAHPAITPLPLLAQGLDATWVGGIVELAGYGVSEHEEPATLRFVTEAIADVTADHVVVDGHGTSGACAGDSGGPLLALAPSGEVRVLGVLDDGPASCVGRDRYTRADRLRGWAPLTALAFEAPPPEADGCGGP